VQRYDDAAAAAFVAAEFPEHAAAYAALPAAVQRADLFRVLVLLRKGGVYADADAACVAPLDALLAADDTLVVGWENAFDTPEQARSRKLLTWIPLARPAPDRRALARVLGFLGGIVHPYIHPAAKADVPTLASLPAGSTAVAKPLPSAPGRSTSPSASTKAASSAAPAADDDSSSSESGSGSDDDNDGDAGKGKVGAAKVRRRPFLLIFFVVSANLATHVVDCGAEEEGKGKGKEGAGTAQEGCAEKG
jgi:hypothetical protein